MRSLLFAALLTGCGLSVPEAPAPSRSASRCEVPAPAGTVKVVATHDSVIFETGHGIQRFVGSGCALELDALSPAMAGELLDADEVGNVYAFPADSSDPAVRATAMPDEFKGDGMVVKIDRLGQVSKVVSAGRGIWSFGISPEGTSLWMTACGPTGIFSLRSGGLVPSMTAPATQWQQFPSVLSGEATFWSVGARTCNELTPECGFALVRSTLEANREVGSTLVDVGHGVEQAVLSRCGARVCGRLSDAVVVWADDGAVVATVRAEHAGEKILQVTGNQHGLYLRLEARVVFVPWRR